VLNHNIWGLPIKNPDAALQKTKNRFRAYPTHQAVQTSESTAGSYNPRWDKPAPAAALRASQQFTPETPD
jgi:hypothetical protein